MKKTPSLVALFCCTVYRKGRTKITFSRDAMWCEFFQTFGFLLAWNREFGDVIEEFLLHLPYYEKGV